MATIIRCRHQWTARIVVDIGTAPEKRMVTTAVDMDVGPTTLAALSHGTEIGKSALDGRAYEDRIAAANRLLAHKKRHSNHRAKGKRNFASCPSAGRECPEELPASGVQMAGGRLRSNRLRSFAYEALKVKSLAQGNLAKSIIGQINH
jgi:hypothetical protein